MFFFCRTEGSTEEMGKEGHMVRECTEEETTRQWVDEQGKTQESYVPNEDVVKEAAGYQGC